MGMMVTIQWVTGEQFHKRKGEHECASCLYKESCGYVGSEGKLMSDGVTDMLGRPLVLLCNGWLQDSSTTPFQRRIQADPYAEQNRQRVMDELKEVEAERVARE